MLTVLLKDTSKEHRECCDKPVTLLCYDSFKPLGHAFTHHTYKRDLFTLFATLWPFHFHKSHSNWFKTFRRKHKKHTRNLYPISLHRLQQVNHCQWSKQCRLHPIQYAMNLMLLAALPYKWQCTYDSASACEMCEKSVLNMSRQAFSTAIIMKAR